MVLFWNNNYISNDLFISIGSNVLFISIDSNDLSIVDSCNDFGSSSSIVTCTGYLKNLKIKILSNF